MAELQEWMEDCPVIAAVKDREGLAQCLQSEIKVVFILFGTVCNIGELVHQVKAAGRCAIVHIDLVSGLSAKEISVDFIRKYTEADGIISTKPALISRAAELGLYTVQRFFVIDSMALANVTRHQGACKPDFIEILPGIMPRVISELAQKTRTPIIAGGLVKYKEEVMAAIRAGAVAVSSSSPAVWAM